MKIATVLMCMFVSLVCLVLDVVQFYIKSHEDTNLFAYQSGRTITEVEKPIPRIQMTGMIRNRRVILGGGENNPN